jgi:hypothetical protein
LHLHTVAKKLRINSSGEEDGPALASSLKVLASLRCPLIIYGSVPEKGIKL